MLHEGDQQSGKVANTKLRVRRPVFAWASKLLSEIYSGFASITKPLTERGRQFCWTCECDRAFESLKSHLVSAPILAFPDCTKPFVLDTNASESGLAVVPSQEHEGEEQVVAYVSRVLSKAETKYCVTIRSCWRLSVSFSNSGTTSWVSDFCFGRIMAPSLGSSISESLRGTLLAGSKNMNSPYCTVRDVKSCCLVHAPL